MGWERREVGSGVGVGARDERRIDIKRKKKEGKWGREE